MPRHDKYHEFSWQLCEPLPQQKHITMKNSLKSALFLFTIFLSGLLCFQTASAQTYTLNNDTSFLEVHGTSSLHDWHVDAEKQMGKLEVSKADGFTISSLNFSVESESLKSGKSGMDKNAYKALKSDDYKTIDFKLSSIETMNKITDNSYKVSALGNMTIAGATKLVPIELNIKLDGNNVLIDGEKTMLMTDFGIDPPRALLGTIKTGDEIKIIFKTAFNTKN